MPKVSVIIPYYNKGDYIDETLQSIMNQTFQDIEIVIVDDGSSNAECKKAFDTIEGSKIKKFRTENQGVSAARNYAISKSTGEYILPIDGDDKIAPTFIEETVRVLDQNSNVLVAYTDVEFIGAKSGKWELPPFSIKQMLTVNVVVNAGMYRKADFFKTKGYPLNMKKGYEDWDFWLSMIELGGDFYKIEKPLFFYRIIEDSRNNSIKDDSELVKQIAFNHIDLCMEHLGSPIKLQQHLKAMQVYETLYKKLNSNIFIRVLMKLFRLK